MVYFQLQKNEKTSQTPGQQEQSSREERKKIIDLIEDNVEDCEMQSELVDDREITKLKCKLQEIKKGKGGFTAEMTVKSPLQMER